MKMTVKTKTTVNGRTPSATEENVIKEFFSKNLPYPALEKIDEVSEPGYIIIEWPSTEIANQYIALTNSQTPPFETIIVS
jgi:hypothetical protein